jgi:uncharacterized protein
VTVERANDSDGIPDRGLSPAPRTMRTMTNTTPSPVTWFEIATDDPDTARAFYGELFGWTFADLGPAYSVVTTGSGNALQGGIRDTSGAQPEGTPRSYAVPYVQVEDVPGACARLEDLGGKVTAPAVTVPGGLVFALATDPAGNLIGLFTPPATQG